MSHRPSPVAEPSEKASLGNSGLAARRSTLRVTTRAAIAATSRPILPSGCSAMALSDMKAMARQISATRRPGTRGTAPSLTVRGSAASANHRQHAGDAGDGEEGAAPVAVAGEHAADQRADQDRQAPGARYERHGARPQAVGKGVAHQDIGHRRQQAAAETLHEAAGDDLAHRRRQRADQRPPRQRSARRRRTRFARRRSPSGSRCRSRQTIDDARKALLVQLIKVAPPTSATTVGSTVDSISTFMECSSTPPTKTATAGSQAGRSSAPQPVFAVSLRHAARLITFRGGGQIAIVAMTDRAKARPTQAYANHRFERVYDGKNGRKIPAALSRNKAVRLGCNQKCAGFWY